MSKSMLVLWNARAGSVPQADVLKQKLRERDDVIFQELETNLDLHRTIESAVQQGCELLVAAGGDGTVSAVANALLEGGFSVPLGILPLGTGNDLSRTLAIPDDPVEAMEVLESKSFRTIDAVRLTVDDRHVFYLNMAAGGNSGEVMKAMDDEVKQFWGPFAYLRGAVEILPELVTYRLTIQCDDRDAEEFSALNLIVANGRSSAGGFPIAPQASLEDGLLDVIVLLDCSPLELAGIGTKLLAGNYLDDEQVVFLRARTLHVDSVPNLPFSADGELITDKSATFEIRPSALTVLVGPEYVSEPAAKPSG